jgi:hypothetical protein
MAGSGEYRLIAIEPMLEEGYQTWPLPTDHATVVGFSDNAGTISLTIDATKGVFWLSAHNCQVPTPTSQNLEIEQQIRISGAG